MHLAPQSQKVAPGGAVNRILGAHAAARHGQAKTVLWREVVRRDAVGEFARRHGISAPP